MTSTTNEQSSSKLQAWYKATRPRVFTASYVPMGVAAAQAIQDEVFRIVPFVLALIGVMLLQTGANLVNEYYDYRRGADTLKVAGQSMVIKKQILTPREVAIGAIASIVAGSLVGLYLLSQSGPLLWGIGIGGVLVAITYTAGPFPLAYNGLGEVAAGIFMGPMIVIGAYYVMEPIYKPDLLWISIPVALMVAAILHANNIRDLDADKSVNKRTLAVRLGRKHAETEYAVLVYGAYASLLALVIVGYFPVSTLIVFVTVSTARRLVATFRDETDPEKLHPAQGQTAKLHGQFGLLLVLGWLAWLVIQALTAG